MPKTVTAAAGDTLCTLATKAGFLNCDALRAEGANASFLNTALKAGDIVTIPDIKIKDLIKAVENIHEFVRKGVPSPAIRFTHGSPDKPYKDDASLTFLNVSNFVSNKAGDDGKAAFPAGFGFNKHGHADIDAFKVEVVEPAGGADLMIELEALKPIYAPDGTVSGHESFSDAQAALRKIKVKCQKVSSPTYKGYRSRYLRLVTDEEDLKTLSGSPVKTDGTAQGLFVSDMADGNNGDADKVEILDQVVRATYVLKGCKAADPHKCKVVAELSLAPNKHRIRLFLNLFRATVGGAAVGAIAEQHLRRRVFKWYRRAYAQAERAPKLVAPGIQLVDPPAANMLVISDNHGNAATSASRITFNLGVAPGGPPPPPPVVPVAVNIAIGQTPAQVGAAVAAAIPAGFAAQAFPNAANPGSVNGSCDVLITRNDGRRLVIRNEACTDGAMTVSVARVNIGSVDASTPNTPNPEVRRITRAAPGTDTRVQCYVIGRWSDPDLRGLALTPDSDLPPNNQNNAPVRWATVMAANSTDGAVMDGGNNLPFTFPHESGHVLLDAFHTSGDGEGQQLMSGSGTSVANAVDATKRLCDDKAQVQYSFFTPQPSPPTPPPPVGDTTTQKISAVQRLWTRGAAAMEGW
jgi:hypothetical protein